MDLTWVWQSLTDYIGSALYISPFWYYAVVIGLPSFAAACAAGWFFPAVRSFIGALVLAGIGWLAGYWKGSADTAAHDKTEAARKTKAQPQGWPWTW